MTYVGEYFVRKNVFFIDVFPIFPYILKYLDPLPKLTRAMAMNEKQFFLLLAFELWRKGARGIRDSVRDKRLAAVRLVLWVPYLSAVGLTIS